LGGKICLLTEAEGGRGDQRGRGFGMGSVSFKGRRLFVAEPRLGVVALETVGSSSSVLTGGHASKRDQRGGEVVEVGFFDNGVGSVWRGGEWNEAVTFVLRRERVGVDGAA